MPSNSCQRRLYACHMRFFSSTTDFLIDYSAERTIIPEKRRSNNNKTFYFLWFPSHWNVTLPYKDDRTREISAYCIQYPGFPTNIAYRECGNDIGQSSIEQTSKMTGWHLQWNNKSFIRWFTSNICGHFICCSQGVCIKQVCKPVRVHIRSIGEVIQISIRGPGINAKTNRWKWRDWFLLFKTSAKQQFQH